MRTWSRGEPLLSLDLEIERPLRQKKKAENDVVIDHIPPMVANGEGNEDQVPPPLPAAKNSLNNRFTPVVENYHKGRWGTVTANTFELKLSLVNMVQAHQYEEGVTKDPNAHLISFLDICSTYKQNRVPSYVIKLTLFGFSLMDEAREWYKSLDHEEINM